MTTRVLKADLEAAIRDALTIENGAQELTRELDVVRRHEADAARDAILEEDSRAHLRESRRLRARMDSIVADAAQQMADRLREVIPDA